MRSIALRRLSAATVAGLMLLAIAVAPAFAGQGSYHGNKYGAAENKPETELCPDGYTWTYGDNGADINGNYIICEKWTPAGYMYVDDSTSTTHFVQ
jgi:hypothetical protein